MEMSANPTALQDNPCRAHRDDKSWPTKDIVRDRVRLPATMKWVGTNRQHGQSQRLS